MATILILIVIIIQFRLNKKPLTQNRLTPSNKWAVLVKMKLFIINITTNKHALIYPFRVIEIVLTIKTVPPRIFFINIMFGLQIQLISDKGVI